MARRENWASPADVERLLRSGRPRRQPERFFTDRLKRFARRGGWLPYHTLHAKGSDPGFLDVLLIRFPRLVVAELKVPPNTSPTDWQEVWLGAWRLLAMLLTLAPWITLRIEVYVWTPSDWEEITRVLE
jgi:hypothetical protein